MVLNTDLKVSARKLHINIFCNASFYPRGCVNPDPAISPNLLEKNMHVRRIHRIVNLLCITYFGLAILVPLSLSQKVSAATSVSPSLVPTAQFTSRMGMPLIIYCGSSVKTFGHVLNNLLLAFPPSQSVRNYSSFPRLVPVPLPKKLETPPGLERAFAERLIIISQDRTVGSSEYRVSHPLVPLDSVMFSLGSCELCLGSR